MKNLLCKIFGHNLSIAMNSEEMWLVCTRKGCKHQEDIPENREQEAYRKIRNHDWKWEKDLLKKNKTDSFKFYLLSIFSVGLFIGSIIMLYLTFLWIIFVW